MYSITREPDEYRIDLEEEKGSAKLRFEKGEGLKVFLSASGDAAPTFVYLRWREKTETPVKVLGDSFERLYGDAEWRGIVPQRIMPWYMIVASEDGVCGCGVKVRPNAMCHWQLDRSGITLVLDVRSASQGVHLGSRELFACEVVSGNYTGVSAFEAARRFCRVMTDAPVLPKEAVYGSNNWYYAYGNSSHGEILADTAFIAEVTKGLENRPHMVIDDGWSPNMTCGPWDRGNERFPDMPGLARQMKEMGVKPGIWVRTLYDASPFVDGGAHTLEGRKHTLDPTDEAVLSYIAENVARIRDWGYTLLKHDYSSVDLTGAWGLSGRRAWVVDGLKYGDRSRTTAEVAKRVYQTIFDNAGDMTVLGCNCLNHLVVGYAHLNRTGDDTSGVYWERTRKMGVNALAFRLCQDGSFFRVDADCVGLTANVPYDLNKEWLRLLAESGTPLFVSAKIDDVTDEMKEDLRAAFALASRGITDCEPLDWTDNTCPAVWRFGARTETFRFDEPFGVTDGT